jgi:hypothetical protein
VQGLRRIDVSVRRDGDPDDSTLVTLAGFVGQTAMAAPQSDVDWYDEDTSGDPNPDEDEDPGDEFDDGSDFEDEEQVPEDEE